jgi:hypothetical protein
MVCTFIIFRLVVLIREYQSLLSFSFVTFNRGLLAV